MFLVQFYSVENLIGTESRSLLQKIGSAGTLYRHDLLHTRIIIEHLICNHHFSIPHDVPIVSYIIRKRISYSISLEISISRIIKSHDDHECIHKRIHETVYSVIHRIKRNFNQIFQGPGVPTNTYIL